MPDNRAPRDDRPVCGGTKEAGTPARFALWARPSESTARLTIPRSTARHALRAGLPGELVLEELGQPDVEQQAGDLPGRESHVAGARARDHRAHPPADVRLGGGHGPGKAPVVFQNFSSTFIPALIPTASSRCVK